MTNLREHVFLNRIRLMFLVATLAILAIPAQQYLLLYSSAVVLWLVIVGMAWIVSLEYMYASAARIYEFHYSSSLIGKLLSNRFWRPESQPSSARATVLSTMASFTSFICVYAMIYMGVSVLDGNSFKVEITEFSTGFYFSLMTAATVGYGDIYPISILAKWLVSSEVLIALIYGIFFFSVLASELQNRRVGNLATSAVAPSEAAVPPVLTASESGELSPDQYITSFTGKVDDVDEKRKHALEKALDIRKFEIDLYWKRAAYFWTFIAATLGGYFAVLKLDGPADSDTLFVLNGLGFTFSIAWYFANRGSKFWQENWERHVDALEDPITGPLYKTVLNYRRLRFRRLVGPFAFSVSRINTILSLYVTTIWVYLAIRSFSTLRGWVEPFRGTNMFVVALFSAGAVIGMYRRGKTGTGNNEVGFIRRDITNKSAS